MKANIANKIFNSLILPILTYGSEVWGVYSNWNFDKWDKSPIEKVHLRFCKYFLGVNSKASNVASRSELGRLPLLISIFSRTLKYITHVTNLPENSIAKQAFYISKELHSQNKKCYYSNTINFLKTFCNAPESLTLEYHIRKQNIPCYKKKIESEYKEIWRNKLQNSKKLNFYKTLKDNYDREKYLDLLKQFRLRSILSKFRISNHNYYLKRLDIMRIILKTILTLTFAKCVI